MFKTAVFTDEVSQDLNRAVNLAKEFKLQGVEIRSVWEKPPQALTDANVETLKKTLDAAGLKVCAISSPFLKCDYGNEEQYRQHLDILRRCIRVAKKLETDIIRGFVFWNTGRAEEIWDDLVALYQEPKNIVEGEGITLGIENEASTHISTAKRLQRFLTDLNSPNIKVVWDPCNEVFAPDGEAPFPDGYNRLKADIAHVHVKDARRDETAKEGARCVPIGEGVVDWKGQFKALIDSDYDGWVALETHWRPVALSEDLLNRPGGSAFSESGEQASYICLGNIFRMLEEI
ncbi:MAG: sugar phosphate isomerase/epimerase [Armatimonadetes bacterium]|nr:sugar phosphate isomerase/epimerase [Armatimonadota bacterium]